MADIFIIDSRYLTFTFLVCLGWQLIFYTVAAGCRFDKVTDFAYGTNFIVLSLLTLGLNLSFSARQIVATVLVFVWGVRLAGYLLTRIIVIGKDHRFDDVRDSWWKFLIWFMLQAGVVWIVSVPQVILNSKDDERELIASDYIGWFLWLVGFAFESIADHQKFIYKNKLHARGEKRWCDVGVWKLSRHPNYFGEICCWWGLFLSVASTLETFEFFSALGPIILTIILVFGSGVPTTEKSTDQTFGANEEYQRWKRRTPILIPFIPGIFSGVWKLIFCCEYPCFASLPNEPSFGEDEEEEP